MWCRPSLGDHDRPPALPETDPATRWTRSRSPPPALPTTEANPKVVYVASPRSDLPGAPSATATFDLPSGADTAVEVAWPSDVNGPVRLAARAAR
jgi:hypothetical protein